MFITKLQLWWLGVLPLLIVIWVAFHLPPNSSRPVAAAELLLADPTETPSGQVKVLLHQRVKVLRDLHSQLLSQYRGGLVPFDAVHRTMRDILHAEMELSESDTERIAILEKVVTQAKENENAAEQRGKAGLASDCDRLMGTAGRLEAEIALHRAKLKVAARPK